MTFEELDLLISALHDYDQQASDKARVHINALLGILDGDLYAAEEAEHAQRLEANRDILLERDREGE